MSVKKGQMNLFIPGADGWEIWTGSSQGQMSLHSATEHYSALEVSHFPSGPIQMAIPVRQVAAVPFRAQTDDLALLEDLAVMQLEKNGTRPVLDGGQLSDHFVYSTAPEETHLTAVVMTPPREGQLPRKSPKAFDISPRCLPFPEGKVVVWRELGRWVFGIGKPGHALYFQILSCDLLDKRAGNEIRLALTQLQMQGLLAEVPEEAVIWEHGSSTDARPEEHEALSIGLGLTVSTVLKPAPTWPTPPSRLLPADVRAERLARKGKQNRTLLMMGLLMVYLGVASYFYLGLKDAKDAAKQAKRDANGISVEAESLLNHQAKWEELRPVVEDQYHPFEVYLAAYRALPNNRSERFIRLTKVSLLNQFREIDSELRVERQIVIEGQTDQEEQPKIALFAGELKESEELKTFRWEFPPETPDKRSGKMTFTYTGNATE